MADPRVNLLLLLPSGRQPLSADELWRYPELARLAEAAGVAGVCVADHVVLGPDVSGYPYGPFHHDPSAPFMEPLTVLAACGAATSRIGLGTHALLAGLRPIALLAKTVATVDQLTRGRLELGVAPGWHRAEYQSLGLSFERRGALLDEVIGGCRRLWQSSPATFETGSARFDGIYCEPRPTRPFGPPVLFAGSMSSRNQRRIVEMGDGWIAPGITTASEVADGVALLRTACQAAGREPSGLKVRAALPVARDDRGVPRLDATLAQAPSFAAAGATDVLVPVAGFVRRSHDLERWFDELSATWRSIGDAG